MEIYLSDNFTPQLSGLDVLDSDMANDFTSAGHIGRSGRHRLSGISLNYRDELLDTRAAETEYEQWGLSSVPGNSDSLHVSSLPNAPKQGMEKVSNSLDSKDPVLGSSFRQSLVSPSTELAHVDNNSLQTGQLSLARFGLFDASGDSTANTVLDDGALRLNYRWSGRIASLIDVRLEVLQNNRLTSTLGTWTGHSVANALVNLADVSGLAAGNYDFRLVARQTDGTDIFSDVRSINILPWLTTSGSFRADTLTYSGAARAYGSSIFLGRGGTDTLALNNISMSDVANINGVGLANFSNTNTNQAIFGGTAFDYLTLRNGREIYFQGIEFLNFADGRLNLMVQPNDTHFTRQWNLHVSDVPSAWRFTQGARNVLLVSLDTGVITTLTNRNNIVDTDPGRLLVDALNDDDDTNGNGHGQQAVSVMASLANNGRGIAGINWHSPVEIHDLYGPDDRVTLQQAVATTLAYARRNNLRVVFQGGIQGEYWLNSGGTQAQLERLIRNNADIAVFAIAAGNGNIDIDNINWANPSVRDGLSGGVARLQTTQRNVIAVGALANRHANNSWANTWQQGLMNAGQVRRASYSNYGRSLTLMAATDSPAIDRFGRMRYFGGTSAANPNMAGIASLVWSVNSALSGGEIRQILTDTAMDLGAVGRDRSFGYGLVNADAAVRRAWALNRNQDVANLHRGRSIIA
ncbi:S8 family serine peptidase [Leptolyngbya cf. ectocarpi LEGE 11479]|uniref:S8 family serine peptidase n=1 Tax=Leptolyngbya cf. ectocarpi LEGE 11479 TaxID=1828722 RepID=A0A928ZTE3_LEPEC|nr:S8 family serine peptidase [Leptolyngbya ectocarpi]MBE9067166.1 S8 family serine peptidase [Leptolyngbya cf. ectocarpi LEGE 11479]